LFVADAKPMFVTYTPSETVKTVTQLLEDSRGRIWIGTANGIFRVETAAQNQTQLQSIEIGLPPPEGNSNYAYALYEDRSGAIWLGTERSLYHLTADNRVTSYTTDAPGAIFFRALYEDKRGIFWAGTSKKGLFQIKLDQNGAPQIAHALTPESGSILEWINDISESFDGKLWLATSGGLVEFTPATDNLANSTFELYTRRTGLNHSYYQCLYEDRAGDLWIGTRANGAFRLARRGLISYGTEENINFIRSIFAARNNDLILVGFLGDPALAAGGSKVTASKKPFKPHRWHIGRFDGQHFEWQLPAFPPHIDHFGWGEQQLSFQSRQTGEWWIATGKGLVRFPAVDFKQLATTPPLALYDEKNGLNPHDVFRIYENSAGDVFVSTSSIKGNGFFKWERASQSLQNLSETAGLPSLKNSLITSFREDHTGNLWVGFHNKGLVRIKPDGRIDVYTDQNELLGSGINSIFSDRRGKLWIATFRGVLRVDEPSLPQPNFASYTIADGLSSNRASAITDDQAGFIYIGNDRDVNRLDPETGKIRFLRVADNLPQREFRAAFTDARGTLWFGTTEGLVRYEPEVSQSVLTRATPEILLTSVKIDGVPQRISALGTKELQLPDLAPEQNQMQIDFVSLSAHGDPQFTYQYKFANESTWSIPDNKRSLNLVNLAPGNYEISIRAVNPEDSVSVQPAQLFFKILPPIYLRPWFLTVAILILATAVYNFYRYRLNSLLEIERTRTRIATDLHDDIGASLSRIAMLSEVVKRQNGFVNEESSKRLTQIADNARSLVDSMSDIVWSIDPRSDSLASVSTRIRSFAADTFEAKNIRWSLNVESELHDLNLSAEHRRCLYLILKEAITNIARHADCQHASVQINAHQQNLIAKITDDGCGLQSADLKRNSRGGRGIVNMKARAAEIGGQLKINLPETGGTEFVLAMPLKQIKTVFK
jgi:ligand-binding sensor domain-containing protein/signal transduction histidine kinase